MFNDVDMLLFIYIIYFVNMRVCMCVYVICGYGSASIC